MKPQITKENAQLNVTEGGRTGRGRGKAGEEGERCGLSKNGERGVEEKYKAESRVTQRYRKGGGKQAVGGVVAEAGERAMVRPERHWRLTRTTSQRWDGDATGPAVWTTFEPPPFRAFVRV